MLVVGTWVEFNTLGNTEFTSSSSLSSPKRGKRENTSINPFLCINNGRRLGLGYQTWLPAATSVLA